MRQRLLVVVLTGVALAGTALVGGWAAVPALVAAQEPWLWPLEGATQVSRGFAPPASRFGTGHRGADLPAEPGAVVRAAGAGRVSYAGLLAGRGVVVVVHGELRTTYEPVRATVSLGEVVRPGEALGTLEPGHAGCPVAACLHWGLRRGEAYLDPVRLVRRGPVRLLPLEAGPAAPAPPDPAGSGVVGLAEPRAAAGPTPAPAGAAPPAPPGWSLRATEAPWGAAALAALLAGLGLLVRRRPDPGPDRPPRTGAGAVTASAEPVEGDGAGARAPVVELGVERLRRRAG